MLCSCMSPKMHIYICINTTAEHISKGPSDVLLMKTPVSIALFQFSLLQSRSAHSCYS
jgi:hypothetical protein